MILKQFAEFRGTFGVPHHGSVRCGAGSGLAGWMPAGLREELWLAVEPRSPDAWLGRRLAKHQTHRPAGGRNACAEGWAWALIVFIGRLVQQEIIAPDS